MTHYILQTILDWMTANIHDYVNGYRQLETGLLREAAFKELGNGEEVEPVEFEAAGLVMIKRWAIMRDQEDEVAVNG